MRTFPVGPSNPTGVRWKAMFTQKPVPSVHSRQMHSRQNPRTTQESPQLNGQTPTAPPQTRKLLNNKNKATVDTGNNLDGAQTHCTEWKNPDAEGLRRHDDGFHPRDTLEKAKLYGWKTDQGPHEANRYREDLAKKKQRQGIWGMGIWEVETFCILTGVQLIGLRICQKPVELYTRESGSPHM